MSAKLLEGKLIAAKIKERIQKEAAELKMQTGRPPKLVALQIGENQASAVYVKSQVKTAEALSIGYELKVMPGATTQTQAEDAIRALNLSLLHI